MNHFRLIFLGFLATFSSSWLGLVVIPSIHYGREHDAIAMVTPTAETELVRHGEQVYAANGCIYCHTQQVRSPQFGSDRARNWGKRR
ncbi:MAG: cytochrome oxidase mono-heme subunit/FixO, partial [Verrucomicrobiaceae bacterium]|nr:cytochrome oxidase mono-heme subunit/FixO [Verrucomicrobiaceae bacterium]